MADINKITSPPDPELIKALEGVLDKKRVSASAIDRAIYSRDIWPRGYFWMRRGEIPYAPSVIVWPETIEELSSVLKLANEKKVPVTPVGAGSGVCGGAVPLMRGIALDLKRMNRIIEVSETNLTCHVEAGAIGEDLERHLKNKGFTLGHFPSSMYCSSVGGWLAARSAGQFSSKYGKIEDMVISIEGVLPDGSIFSTRRTPRAAAGPDIDQVLIGSEGTLAVITSTLLSIHRYPGTRWLRGYLFPDIPSGLDAIRLVMRKGLDPMVVRLYDELDTKVNAQKMGFEGQGCLMIIGFEGPDSRLTHAKIKLAEKTILDLNGKDLGPGPGEMWLAHRYSISYKQSKVLSAGNTILDTVEVATTWSRLLELYNEMRAALIEHVMVMAHFSHAYPDGCSVYFTIAGNAEEGSADELYERAWKAALDTCVKVGGTISHHHSVGCHKQAWMKHELGPALEIYKGLKKYLDPNNILNPGKMGLEEIYKT